MDHIVLKGPVQNDLIWAFWAQLFDFFFLSSSDVNKTDKSGELISHQ